ncbi:Hypothetical predicted protein [Mytilus galloprovincialis]|uniref:Reverse transcriptase domain-containing protein n=1 Tax=Mytilus galloprovincialis TaxID=29158 RepID=A0A8B6BXG6_MYTGA|nr:Hypothetical predicted protein [Mytilus galloprovincialis]
MKFRSDVTVMRSRLLLGYSSRSRDKREWTYSRSIKNWLLVIWTRNKKRKEIINFISSFECYFTPCRGKRDRKFWNLESLGIRLPQQDDEESFVKTYQQDCIKFENERYSAKLPWKLDHPDLPSNIMIAKTRTESTIRRLSREPHLLRKYSEIIEDQMKRGFIEKVNDKNDNGKSTHYIPHHAVKKDSTTTPIRIVYDCSCKKSPDHASLNDCLMSTPPDLNDLTKILMGFRTKKYAISTDIEKAFLHIGLDEKDRDFTRFFWLSDTDNPSSTLTTYRFKSILFGANKFTVHPKCNTA